MVHADASCCVTHTHTFTRSSDHSVPVGERSPGRKLHFQYPSVSFPAFIIQGSSHLLLHILSITVLTAPLLFSSGCPPPHPPTHTCIHTRWRGGKAYGDGRWGCSALSASMMERLASLWRRSSCFTVCLMYSGPLECDQHSTGEQIAVKA